MSIKQEQIQRELEAIRLVKQSRLEKTELMNSLQETFSEEIQTLSESLTKWYATMQDPKDDNALLYQKLVFSIETPVMAELIIRAIFEGLMITTHQSVNYQFIVDRLLIQRYLRSMLPPEERVILPKYKFLVIDRLVTRSVRLLTTLFSESMVRERNAKGEVETFYTVHLTELGRERLAKVPLNQVISDVPMYCKPQPWTSVFDGGYLTADAQRGNPLIQSKRLSYRELRAIDKELQANPQIFEAVNKMQNVSFRIDQKSKDYQNTIAQVRKRKIKECDRKITAYVEQIAKLKSDLAQVDPI